MKQDRWHPCEDKFNQSSKHLPQDRNILIDFAADILKREAITPDGHVIKSWT